MPVLILEARTVSTQMTHGHLYRTLWATVTGM
jgi:hypothetical protein